MQLCTFDADVDVFTTDQHCSLCTSSYPCTSVLSCLTCKLSAKVPAGADEAGGANEGGGTADIQAQRQPVP